MEFHPLCLLLSFREEVVDELAELMASHGWYPQEHITLYEGQILDGRHRYLAAQKAGVEPQFTDFEGDNPAATAFVFGVNYMSRPWRNSDKKDFFLKARDGGFWEKRAHGGAGNTKSLSNAANAPSQQEIADVLGVNRVTVQRWESENEGRTPIRADTSGNDEWYTPTKYIDMAREVMGGIDLDPASCEFAQKEVRAEAFYTEKDDGLEQQWRGRIWLNPPYSKGLIDKFVEKVCAEFVLGGVEQAIVLTHNFTDTGWFHKLMSCATAVCFTKGRVKFYNKEGVGNSPTSGHVFLYFGQNVEAFAEKFSEVGVVCIPHGGS